MPTIRRYLDPFTDLLLVQQLVPWHENIAKRQVKSPKVYLRDSGVLHALLSLATERELLSHPKVGSSWEGYIIEETIRRLETSAAYFWATHAGAELDLQLERLAVVYPGQQAYALDRNIEVLPLPEIGQLVAPRARTTRRPARSPLSEPS